MLHQPFTSFNAGEFSPWLDGRIDLEKYGSGCRILENFLLTPYGGVRRRPGMEYVDLCRDSSREARLIPMEVSTSTNYLLVLNGGKIRVYRAGSEPSRVLEVELDHPWGDGDLFQIQFAQLNDVIYFVHGSYPPQKLSRFSETNWTLVPVPFDRVPLAEENVSGIELRAIAGSLRATQPYFVADHVGSRIQLCHNREPGGFEVQLSLDSSGISPEITVEGEWQLTTGGGTTWIGVLNVEVNRGLGWETLRSFNVKGDRNLSIGGEEVEPVKMRLNYSRGSGGDSQTNAILQAIEGEVCGEYEVTQFVDPNEVRAIAIREAASDKLTDQWTEGAFSEKNGYPTSVTFHEGRLIFAGTRRQEQGIWASRSDDYENFRRGTDDDDSWFYELASGQQNSVLWMASESRLLIGTSGGEFVLGSGRDDALITPSSVQAKRHSNYGSELIQPVFVNDSVLYAQRNGRKIREYSYSFERDRYQASDLTLLAEHITAGGVVQMDFQKQRDSILWTVARDGSLVGLTYEREQSVIGWHRHTTRGKIESVAVVTGEREEDEIWVVVRREVSGEINRHIERLQPDQYRVQEEERKDEYFYLDSGVRVSGDELVSEVNGLFHLEGETVGVIGDGAEQPDRVVNGGSIVLATPAKKVSVGLRFASRLQPMKISAQQQDGTSRTREGRVNRIGLTLWHSLGGEFGESTEDGARRDSIRYRDTSDRMDESPPAFTGEMELDFDGDYHLEEGVSIGIVNDSVYPMAVLMLVAKVQFFGND